MTNRNVLFSIIVFALMLTGLQSPASGANFSIVSNVNEAYMNPAIAFNSDPEHQEYLVVYEDGAISGNHNIRAKIVRSDGTVKSSFSISTDALSEFNPRVAYNSFKNQYMIVWEYETNVSNHDIKAKIIDAEGGMVIDTFTPAGWPGTETDPDIAYNAIDNEYMVVWVGGTTDNKDIYGRIFNYLGDAITLPHISSGTYNETAPCVTYNFTHNNYLVLWHGRPEGPFSTYSIYGKVVTTNGLPGSIKTIATSGWDFNPRAAWNPTAQEYLVVFEKASAVTNAETVEVTGQRINAAGDLQGSPFEISGTGPGGTDKYGYQDVTFNAISNEYLVAYVYVWSDTVENTDFDIYCRQVTVDPENTYLGNELVVSALGANETVPSVVSGPNAGHLMTWQDYRNSQINPDIYGTILGKPNVINVGAGYIDSSFAQLRGEVNPNGKPTNYHFDYGLTTAYGSVTPTVSAGSGTTYQFKYENISGLLPNATYYFRLVAVNDMGQAWSEGSFHTLDANPTVTTTPESDIHSTFVTLNGEINPNGTETQYAFEYGTTTSYGSWTSPVKSAGSGRVGIPVFENITGLLPNQTYHFRLVGIRGTTKYYGNDQDFKTGVTVPSVQATSPSHITSNQIRFNGTVNPNGSAVYYQFQYGPVTGTEFETSQLTLAAGYSSLPVSAVLNGLSPGDSGRYRLKAWNISGLTIPQYSGFQNYTTTVIQTADPAVQETSDSAVINGIINPAGSETTYWFEYWITQEGESSALETEHISAGSGTGDVPISFEISTLIQDKNYTYRLYAENAWGEIFSDPQTKSFQTLQEYYVSSGMWPNTRRPWYFYQPRSVATDSDGNVYVADTLNHRVQKFTSNGHLLKEWGKEGDQDKEFNMPMGIAVDAENSVYVADTLNRRIQKFDADGIFLTKWSCPVITGPLPLIDGLPFRLTITDDGAVFICVIGASNGAISDSRIQIFVQKNDGSGEYEYYTHELYDPEGNDFANGSGSGPGQFNFGNIFSFDGDIASRTSCAPTYDFETRKFEWHCGYTIFVADFGNNRVQAIDANGTLKSGWEWLGAPGEDFSGPNGIVVPKFDKNHLLAVGNNYVHVLDSGNNNVKVFENDGDFVRQFPIPLDENGEVMDPKSIAIDPSGSIYMTNASGYPVQKFSPEGELIARWAGNSSLPGAYDLPEGICLDRERFLYVADTNNHRIQKFNSQMEQVGEWYKSGGAARVDWLPKDIAFSPDDLLFVAAEGSIQVFDLDGEYIKDLDQLTSPTGVAVDSALNIYVTELSNDRIYKYSENGDLIFSQNHDGRGPGFEFLNPTSIACDAGNNIYVTDYGHYRVVKMSSTGGFITQWGSYGVGDGQFKGGMTGITVGGDGFVYVADSHNNRIQKFTPDGRYAAQFGEKGFVPGKFNGPTAVKYFKNFEDKENICAVDKLNNRIQLFEKRTQATNNKAIILAGGGNGSLNALWKSTKVSTDFAAWVLGYQGFGPNNIRYLSSESEDNPFAGELIPATSSNLQDAITDWAAEPTTTGLTIFLSDHGGQGTFRINENEILSSEELNSWISLLQAGLNIPVTVIIDSCYSGSFKAGVVPDPGVVAASAGPGELAQFAGQGWLSFSTSFWMNIFQGKNIQSAFNQAYTQIQSIFPDQHPEINEYTVSAGSMHIGNGIPSSGIPTIGTPTGVGNVSDNTATIYASDIQSDYGISMVWAVVIPPLSSLLEQEKPIVEFPRVDMAWSASTSRWEGEFKDFSHAGTYRMMVYAMDKIGATSAPVTIEAQMTPGKQRKAMIILGGRNTHENFKAFKASAKTAYQALKWQGYSDDNIEFLSPEIFDGVDDTADKITIGDYFTALTSGSDTKDLVLYMIGPGKTNSFEVHDGQEISPLELSGWLGFLKTAMIYDADFSGGFIKKLGSANRILVTSTSSVGRSHFISEGKFSFSKSFWTQVFTGTNVWNAFSFAKNEIQYATGQDQKPELDDDGDGICCELDEGGKATEFFIGSGIRMAANDPQVGSVGIQNIIGDSFKIRADNVTATGTIEEVWASITPPGYIDSPDAQILVLTQTGPGSYEGTFNDFDAYGTYTIAISARDTDGNVSKVREKQIKRTDGPDIYEIDDASSQATVFYTDGPAQHHNFHNANDQDWIKFYGKKGTYDIRADTIGGNCNLTISLFNKDDLIVPIISSQGGPITYNLDVELYYVRVQNLNSPADCIGYDLSVSRTEGGLFGDLQGFVISETGEFVGGAEVILSLNNQAGTVYKEITRNSGSYDFYSITSGTYTSDIVKTGYTHEPVNNVAVIAGAVNGAYFVVAPSTPVVSGDINGDGVVNQTDADLVMDVLTGGTPSNPPLYIIRPNYAASGADVNQDGIIGPEELIYILGIITP